MAITGNSLTAIPEITPVIAIMTGNPTRQFEVYPTRAAADAWYERLVTSACQVDVNEVLYQYDASSDYDPSPDLEKIEARLLAIEFDDDQINSPGFAALDHEMPRVTIGRYVIIQTDEQGQRRGGKHWQRRIVGSSFARSPWLAHSLSQ